MRVTWIQWLCMVDSMGVEAEWDLLELIRAQADNQRLMLQGVETLIAVVNHLQSEITELQTQRALEADADA